MSAEAVTPDQVSIIADTFAEIGPVARDAGLSFYRTLFEIDPTTRRPFAADIEEQSKKLMQVLAFTVGKLNYPDELLALVRKLGVRHAYYGAEEAHYASVEKALMAALERFTSAKWTTEATVAWKSAFALLAREMIAAQRSVMDARERPDA